MQTGFFFKKFRLQYVSPNLLEATKLQYLYTNLLYFAHKVGFHTSPDHTRDHPLIKTEMIAINNIPVDIGKANSADAIRTDSVLGDTQVGGAKWSCVLLR